MKWLDDQGAFKNYQSSVVSNYLSSSLGITFGITLPRGQRRNIRPKGVPLRAVWTPLDTRDHAGQEGQTCAGASYGLLIVQVGLLEPTEAGRKIEAAPCLASPEDQEGGFEAR
jgi:hypothetical protein